MHEVIESSSHVSPRLVCSLNSGGVSSHACVSRGLSASASARAPAALGVVPMVVPLAVAGDAGECMTVSHHCMMTVIRCWHSGSS